MEPEKKSLEKEIPNLETIMTSGAMLNFPGSCAILLWLGGEGIVVSQRLQVYGQDSRELQDRGFAKGRQRRERAYICTM